VSGLLQDRKLRLIFRAWDIIYRSIVWFLSGAEGLRIFRVSGITLFVELLIRLALKAGNAGVQNMGLRDLRNNRIGDLICRGAEELSGVK